MFLATTSIEEFWDESEKILFLGPWCVPYENKQCLQKYLRNGYEFHPLLWENTSDIETAVAYCFDVFLESLSEITGILNEIHGLNKGQRYYHCIVGHWLYMFIHQAYDKYLSLKSVIEKHPVIKTLILENEQHYIPTNTADMIVKLCENDMYNLQIYSQIAEHLDIDSCKKEINKPLAQEYSYKTKTSNINNSHGLNDKFFSLMNALFNKNTVSITAPYFRKKSDFYKLALRSRFLFIHDDMNNYHLDIPFNIGGNLRKSISTNNVGDEFRQIISGMIFRNIPAIYLEGFSEFRKNVLILPIKKADVYYTTSNMYMNDIFKVVAAEHIGKSIIVSHQHGGNYNTTAAPAEEHVERMCSDIFYTWGWKDSDITKPLPHPMLNRPAISNADPSLRKPLLVLTSHPKQVFRIQIPVISSRFDDYLDEIRRFILSHGDEIIVRPSPSDFQQHSMKKLKQGIGNVMFDDCNNSFIDSILNATVVIQGHLATTYLECIAMDIPVIIFLNPARYSFVPSSRPLFEKMKLAGILHDSPESAATHLKNLSGNINDWWKSDSVQTFLDEFKYQHARTDTNWTATWTREFKSLLVKDKNNKIL